MKVQKKNTTDTNIFPERLTTIMEEQGVTQTALAKAIGVTRQAIAQYQKGRTSPDIILFSKIAIALDVSFDYLLGYSEAKHRENHNIAEETGLTEDAITKLKEWQDTVGVPNWDKAVGPDKHRGKMVLIKNKITKAPVELSEMITHGYFRRLIDLICAAKYISGNKARLENRDSALGPNKIEALKKEMGANNTREYVAFMIQNTFRKMIDDIAPYVPKDELRDATQADIDDFYFRKGDN